MSSDIDINSYTGELVPAAVEQQVDTNFYQQETSDVSPVNQELLDSSLQTDVNSQPFRQDNNFRALREEVDRIKAEREAEKRDHQVQLEMLRANAMQQQSQPQSKPREMFENLDPDYVPNVAELRREWADREAGYQAKLEELQVQSMHSDYAEVMEKYTVPLVRQKPHLADGIQGARNKALFAYELGKMAQEIQASRALPTSAVPQRNENAQRMIDNSKKPGTLSQAGGQGALSKADYFASMSDSEFAKFASRNLEGI